MIETTEQTWKSFMPPLEIFDIKSESIKSLEDAFYGELKEYLKSNKKKQISNIDLIKSKLLFKSLRVISDINNIVRKKTLLLQSKSGIPFLENACCETTKNESVLEYFKHKDQDPEQHISSELEEIRSLKKKLYEYTKEYNTIEYLFSDIDTKLKTPTIDTKFSESTIYQGFIKFCEINKDIVLSDNVESFCKNRKSGFNREDTLEEKIRILKQEGNQDIMTYENFENLLRVINKNRKIEITTTVPDSQRVLFEKMLDKYTESGIEEEKEEDEEEKDSRGDTDIYTLFKELINRYSFEKDEDDEIYNKLYDLISEQNNSYTREINKRFDSNKESDKKCITFISELDKFKEQDKTLLHESNDTTMEFKLPFLVNTVKQLLEDFPNIILHKVDDSHFEDKGKSKHWNFSVEHYKELSKCICESYKPITDIQKEKLENILINVINNKNKILDLVNLLQFHYDKYINKNKVESIFNYKLVNKVLIHSILSSFTLYINEFKNEYDDNEEEDVNVERQFNSLLGSYCSVLSKQKSIININKETITQKMNLSKDREKNRILNILERMSEEERQADNELKFNKIGRWGVGKNVTQYNEETQEREYIERDERGDSGLFSDMSMEEQEAYDMTGQHDDDEIDEAYQGYE